MQPLNDPAIRSSFINASRREVREATAPDLAEIDWTATDLIGWRDRKKDNTAYVVLELDGAPTGVRLTAAPKAGPRRRTLCAWCRDVVVATDVTMYVARRAGAPGRAGNTIGTLICTDFGCNGNVRRTPTLSEVGSRDEVDRMNLIDKRIRALRAHSSDFVRQVAATR
ncbi:FBP domain-containing protein [Flexivirga caeni]|uniref:FBP domain-containing protein n=1 Tax=Flexivirga caeni TaxID=2294115 RepID=A0A3M9MI52_9MICO|nr:FBP domain-containing protein [Flexivirga caeni]RNI24875.1 FBP domain-containing protein [Flexivirga caeni]